MSDSGLQILLYLGLAAATHVLVMLIRYGAMRFARTVQHRRYRKLQSIATVGSSVVVFALYFLLVGLILSKFGVELRDYLVSASVIGLAIGFGSQGIVQDVVTGLTLIFSDLIDVGDLVDVSGQAGIVRSISMRFVELESAFGARVFIPNRTVGNVTNYARGYVRCLVDVTLIGDAAVRRRMEEAATRHMAGFHEQYPAILIAPPALCGRSTVASGKEFLRLEFRIWPNRGGPIEGVFVQELVAALKIEDVAYQPWMVAVTYEAGARMSRRVPPLPWLLRSRR